MDEIVQDDQKRYDYLQGKLFKKDGTPKANASERDMNEFYETEDRLTRPEDGAEPVKIETLTDFPSEAKKDSEPVTTATGVQGDEIPVLHDILKQVNSLTHRLCKLESQVAQSSVIIGGLQADVALRLPEPDLSDLPTIREGAEVKIGKRKVIDTVCGQPHEHYVDAG